MLQQVYPHVCGVTAVTGFTAATVMGLSPRVWGNPQCPSIDGQQSRSIPTCVG